MERSKNARVIFFRESKEITDATLPRCSFVRLPACRGEKEIQPNEITVIPSRYNSIRTTNPDQGRCFSRRNKTFDAVIIEQLWYQCYYALVNHYNSPVLIGFLSVGNLPYVMDSVGKHGIERRLNNCRETRTLYEGKCRVTWVVSRRSFPLLSGPKIDNCRKPSVKQKPARLDEKREPSWHRTKSTRRSWN